MRSLCLSLSVSFSGRRSALSTHQTNSNKTCCLHQTNISDSCSFSTRSTLRRHFSSRQTFQGVVLSQCDKKILANFSVSIGPAFRILLYLRNPDVQLTHIKSFSTLSTDILFAGKFIFRRVVSMLDFWWEIFQQYRIVVTWYYILINKHYVQLYK